MESSSLLRLPAELLHMVIEDADGSTLASIAQTCRVLNAMATPRLYREPEIKRGKSNEFIRTISNKYSHLVRHLTVESYEPHISPCRIAPCLEKLENLESLALTGQYMFWDDWDEDDPKAEKWDTLETAMGRYFERASLNEPAPSRISPNLRSLTIERVGEKYQPALFTTYCTDFLVMPQLQELTLRGFMMNRDIDFSVDYEHERQTELKSLRIERCWVSFEGLKTALLAPRALQYLSIGHCEAMRFHDYETADLNDATLEELMECLIPHRDSLEGIKIVYSGADTIHKIIKQNDPSFQACADQLPKLKHWEGCDELSLAFFLTGRG